MKKKRGKNNFNLIIVIVIIVLVLILAIIFSGNYFKKVGKSSSGKGELPSGGIFTQGAKTVLNAINFSQQSNSQIYKSQDSNGAIITLNSSGGKEVIINYSGDILDVQTWNGDVYLNNVVSSFQSKSWDLYFAHPLGILADNQGNKIHTKENEIIDVNEKYIWKEFGDGIIYTYKGVFCPLPGDWNCTPNTESFWHFGEMDLYNDIGAYQTQVYLRGKNSNWTYGSNTLYYCFSEDNRTFTINWGDGASYCNPGNQVSYTSELKLKNGNFIAIGTLDNLGLQYNLDISGSMPGVVFIETSGDILLIPIDCTQTSCSIASPLSTIATQGVIPPCVENWLCLSWGSCSNNQQTRTCTDSNNCGTISNKPALTKSCTATCNENWQCGSWSNCINNQQTRTCTDSNNCGTVSNKPSSTQSCSIESINANGSASSPISSGNEDSSNTQAQESSSNKNNQTEVICNGCILNKECVESGYRSQGKYCNLSGEFKTQNKKGLQCQNNYECDSNSCIDNKCTSNSLWAKIMTWFSHLFGGK